MRFKYWVCGKVVTFEDTLETLSRKSVTNVKNIHRMFLAGSPFYVEISGILPLLRWLRKVFTSLIKNATQLSGVTSTIDKPSPSDIFPQDAISQTGTGITIDFRQSSIPFTKLPSVWISAIPGTKSMDPVFDKEHNNIYIKGADEANQSILIEWLAEEWFTNKRANMIVYRDQDSTLIIHRLSEISISNGMREWRFKGDNNKTEDPCVVYDNQIEWVLATIIY